jgi:hypothetical protein
VIGSVSKFKLGRVGQIKNAHASKPAKIGLRSHVLEAVGRDAAVFDAFAGAGEMYRGIWYVARAYVGCDLEWHRDGRLAYVADNRRVMRCIDLTQFAIFDFDAHGSPWEQAVILAARRPVAPGERIGLVITEGSGLNLKTGKLGNALGQLIGMTVRVDGMMRWQDEILTRAINAIARRMKCDVELRWQAKGKTGAAVVYAGVVLRGRLN